MIDPNLLQISSPPSLLTSGVATLGFSLWIRYRKGYFPRPRHITAHFLFSLSATILVSYKRLESQKRSREAVRRMIDSTEKTIEIRSKSSDALKVSVDEYDDATGVVAEKETAALFRQFISSKT